MFKVPNFKTLSPQLKMIIKHHDKYWYRFLHVFIFSSPRFELHKLSSCKMHCYTIIKKVHT